MFPNKVVTFKQRSKRHTYRLAKQSAVNYLNATNLDLLINNVNSQSSPTINAVTLASNSADSNIFQDQPADLEQSFTDNKMQVTKEIDTGESHGTDVSMQSECFEVNDPGDATFLCVQESSQSTASVFLKEWAIKNNITHTATSELLVWFKTNPDTSNLPVDARTLLKTPRMVNIQKMGTGNFYYFGLKKALHRVVDKYDAWRKNLTLDFNVDGLPIHKSTNEQFWPILCKIRDYEEFPFPIAIFCGVSKPPLEEFLKNFVEELSIYLTQGLFIGSKHVSFTVGAFCCDTPARAYIKNIKGHNAYSGCDKCYSEGLYVNKRMTFPELNSLKRTDENFSLNEDLNHHKENTPLSQLRIGLISNFPVDYMHCLCLGVVRKLMFTWKDGRRLYGFTKENIAILNTRIEAIKKHWPSDFNRKPRSLNDIERWKATEWRQFLLYVGPVILTDILSPRVYANFMLLVYSAHILLSTTLNEHYNNYACQLIKLFIQHAVHIYGNEICTYNMHALSHLSADAKNNNGLNDISCFPFENYLGKMKRLLRKSNLPLQQIVHRLSESEENVKLTIRSTSNIYTCGIPEVNVDHEITANFHGTFYSRLMFKNSKLSGNDCDSCVLLKCGQIFKIKCFMTHHNDCIRVIGSKLSIVKSFTTYPTDSEFLKMYDVGKPEIVDSYTCHKIDEVLCKGVLLPCGSNYVFQPLLHLT